DVKMHINPKGMEVYAVQYYLTYDTSVVRAETQTKGPFLGGTHDTIVVVNEIDQPHGEIAYAETRKIDGGMVVEDNVTNIHFIAIGPRGATTTLHIDRVVISDPDGNAMGVEMMDGDVEITVNTPPVPISVTKHRINNVAQKYQSTAILCSCSYDPDYLGKGGNITYIRWAFGDGQYGTSEGLPDENNCTCKEHRYESWQWDPLGVPYDPENPEDGGNYVPFDVQLDVMDDGCPELTNNTNITIDVFIAGDANGDGEVNILDAVWVGKNWRAECACNPYPDDYPETLPDYCGCDDCEGNYWSDAQAGNGADGADLNNDCEINILDAVIIGANWRHVAW
ncbi:MAG: dockerin type I domain-containing protein, partial [Euryarchaeota archaeon]|nr:dockerin type I domain-containing protein [Euryarchaeota archaeon]